MTGEKGFLKRLGIMAAGGAALWLIYKYLLGALAPFLLAWLTASLSEPVIVQMAEKCRIRRSYAGVLCSLVVLLSVVGVTALTVSRLWWELAGLAEHLPRRLAFLPGLLDSLQGVGEGFVSSAPPGLKSYLAAAGESIAAAAAGLPAKLSQRLLEGLGKAASVLPSAALFTATYAVSVFFISASYPKMIAFFMCQLPEAWQVRVREAVRAMGSGFGKWLRAQLAMSGVMLAVLLIVYRLLGVASPLVLAAVTALVEALPVLGAGAVLVPWAVWELFAGTVGRAAALGGAWLLCMGLRSFLEPRLVGRQSGLSPAAALLAAYCGWRFVGVGGLLLFPLGLVMLKEMNDCGVVHLWNTPQKTAQNAPPAPQAKG